jgi:hypothetical protein
MEPAMEIVGGRKYVDVPGEKTHELPPLLMATAPEPGRMDHAMEMASRLVEAEEMIPTLPVLDPNLEQLLESRRLDLAVQLVEQYAGLVQHWRVGDSVLEWIRQCEATFELRQDLRPLLRADVWPHAGRTSFVTLLRDKKVDARGIDLERAVGTRLNFRQPPPLGCFSNNFLLLLKGNVAQAAYHAWASLSPSPEASLPPERFSFQVLDMDEVH